MKSSLTLTLLLFFSSLTFAQPSESELSGPLQGVETRNSDFFRSQYLHNNLAHYLDNYSDYITYQSETTGDFQLPDLQVFSITGNSFKWNKYYLDGFRIDNRFFPGSSYYSPDLYNHSLIIDSYNTRIEYRTDAEIKNSLGLRYNVGGLGGISPSSETLVNLYHPTASQRLYKPIEYRRKMKYSGSLFLDYNLKANGKKLPQQLYLDFGQRMLVGFDYEGINSYYPEDFMHLQMNGELPFKFGHLFTSTHYLVNVSNRQNLFTELNYARNESAKYRNIQASLYGTKHLSDLNYTTGLTVAYQTIAHNDLNFSRNLMDQDGEAFEPWYPDGDELEISHAFNFKKQLADNISLQADAYNSLIQFKPAFQEFTETAFAENVNFPYQSLYIYDWSSREFLSGLLENRVRLNYMRPLNSNWNLTAYADATLDGMLLAEKSMIRPNWQLQLNFKYEPSDRFRLELNVGRRRATFNYDHIRFLSNDYLNGELYYWKDENNDHIYQENEKGDFFTTSGGSYHKTVPHLKQPTYFVFDFPLIYRLGKHTFSMISTYKKYAHQWTTQFDKAASEYGDYASQSWDPVFFLGSGLVNYQVQEYPDEYFAEATFLRFASNSPYYLSNMVKYEYQSAKFLFSFSWTSYIMAGVSPLGNGPLQNNIDVLSESSANPNSLDRIIGRLDQDRALAARIFLAYRFNEKWKLALTGKFKDGQPFTNFKTRLVTADNGNQQLVIWNRRTKGINPFTHEFGSRDDAFFNTEIRISYANTIGNLPFDIQLMGYNLYDFGTELVEYSFQPDETTTRYAMELNIPRGLICTARFYFN